MSMTAKTMDVTPELASRWLATNPANRSLADGTVRRYAEAMKRDGWREGTGETIKFDTDGNLVDGQHRLAAVVLAGITVRFLIVRGIDRNVVDVIDTGRKRSVADRLHMLGEVNAKALAGAIQTHARLSSARTLGNAIRSGQSTLSTPEALAWLEDHPDLRNCVNDGQGVHRIFGGSRATYSALIYEMRARDPEDSEAFVARLKSGAELADDAPIFQLRRVLLAEANAKARLHEAVIAALWVKAWNAYREGVPMRSLKFRAGGANPEQFPEML